MVPAVSSAKPSADLVQSLAGYKQVTISKDVDGILSFVYQGVFSLMPKEVLKGFLTQMYKSGKTAAVKGIEYRDIGPVRNYSKGQFSVVKYQLETELSRPGDATPEMDKKVIEILKKKMGADALIVIDEKRDFFNVKIMSVILAINEAQSGWRVVEKDKLAMLERAGILPADLMAQLK